MKRFTFSLLPLVLMGLCQPASAQDPDLPIIPGLEAIGGGAAQGGEIAVPAGDSLNLLNVTGDDISALYRKWTGKRVLVSSAAAAAEFRFVQPGPLTYAQAADILEKQLLMEGFVLVPSGRDEVKLVLSSGQGATPQDQGLGFYTDPLQLPDGDFLVTYAMTLNFLKPEEAARTFQQVISSAPGNTITAVPNASSVLITGKTPVIRTLIEIKDRIDVPSASISKRIVELKHADVEEVAELLSQIFGQNQSQTSARTQRAGGGAPTAPPVPGLPRAANPVADGGGGAGEETPPQIFPYPRTNKIFLIGRPIDLVFIEGIIEDLDTPIDNRNFLRRKVNYLAVADFLDVAVEALQEPGGSEGGGGAPTVGNPNGGGSNRGGGGGGGGSGLGSSNGGTRGDLLSDPEINNAPIATRIGKTLLVADNISNSIIVQGPPQSVVLINNLLDELDVRSDQIMISAVFGQLSLNDTTSSGFNILAAISGDSPLLGGGAGGGGPAFDLEALARQPGGTVSPETQGTNGSSLLVPTTRGVIPSLASNAGLNIYGQIGDFTAFLRALESSSNFTTLARPTVYTTNNSKATLESGRRIAIPTGTNAFGSNFSTNVDYEDVVLKLEVIPLVNSDEEVTLEIALVSDDVGVTQVVSDDLSVPQIVTRSVVTTVTVPNNGTVALGGLITTSDRFSNSGVPILKDVPLLGRLFSSREKVQDRDELVIFIRPTIVNSAGTYHYAQDDFLNSNALSEEALEFANPSVLPPKKTVTKTVKKRRRPQPSAKAPVPEVIQVETVETVEQRSYAIEKVESRRNEASGFMRRRR